MIELDSASGIIQIPKVFDYQDLMDKLKNILQIDDELFKSFYEKSTGGTECNWKVECGL